MKGLLQRLNASVTSSTDLPIRLIWATVCRIVAQAVLTTEHAGAANDSTSSAGFLGPSVLNLLKNLTEAPLAVTAAQSSTTAGEGGGGAETADEPMEGVTPSADTADDGSSSDRVAFADACQQLRGERVSRAQYELLTESATDLSTIAQTLLKGEADAKHVQREPLLAAFASTVFESWEGFAAAAEAGTVADEAYPHIRILESKAQVRAEMQAYSVTCLMLELLHFCRLQSAHARAISLTDARAPYPLDHFDNDRLLSNLFKLLVLGSSRLQQASYRLLAHLVPLTPLDALNKLWTATTSTLLPAEWKFAEQPLLQFVLQVAGSMHTPRTHTAAFAEQSADSPRPLPFGVGHAISAVALEATAVLRRIIQPGAIAATTSPSLARSSSTGSSLIRSESGGAGLTRSSSLDQHGTDTAIMMEVRQEAVAMLVAAVKQGNEWVADKSVSPLAITATMGALAVLGGATEIVRAGAVVELVVLPSSLAEGALNEHVSFDRTSIQLALGAVGIVLNCGSGQQRGAIAVQFDRASGPVVIPQQCVAPVNTSPALPAVAMRSCDLSLYGEPLAELVVAILSKPSRTPLLWPEAGSGTVPTHNQDESRQAQSDLWFAIGRRVRRHRQTTSFSVFCLLFSVSLHTLATRFSLTHAVIGLTAI